MKPRSREAWLKIGAFAVIGIFLLDRMVLSPATEAWKAQGVRLAELRQRVERGENLIEREKSLRERWAEMERTDLPDDFPLAESEVLKSISRWAIDSRATFSNLTQGWENGGGDGIDTFECRLTASGDQMTLGRLLYEIETDPLPARVEELEFSARDAAGKNLSLMVRFSSVRIAEAGRAAK